MEKKTKHQKPDGVETSDEDDDEIVDNLNSIKHPIKKGCRQSVSAEVFGKNNKPEAFKPVVNPKAADICKRLEARLSEAFMFRALEGKDKEVVINAMKQCNFKANDWVINQGDDGDVLYVVDSGT